MATNNKTTGVFTDDERAAMRQRAKELAAEQKSNKTREQGEKDIIGALAKMPEFDKTMGTKIHEIVKANAPELFPKTWYGMPAYADKDGKVICFFQAADKFKARYATLGFSDLAKLDEGNMWANAFALMKLSAEEENEIIKLVKKAIG